MQLRSVGRIGNRVAAKVSAYSTWGAHSTGLARGNYPKMHNYTVNHLKMLHVQVAR